MKKTLIIFALILLMGGVCFYFYFPVQNGSLVGNWFVVGDADLTNTTWKINRLNIIKPDAYQVSKVERVSWYSISRDDSLFIIHDLLFDANSVFQGILSKITEDTVLFSEIDTSSNFLKSLMFIRLTEKTDSEIPFHKMENIMTEGYWSYQIDSLEFDLTFTLEHWLGEIDRPFLVHSYSNNDFESPNSTWYLSNQSNQFILSIQENYSHKMQNFMFHKVTTDSIYATLFWGTDLIRPVILTHTQSIK